MTDNGHMLPRPSIPDTRYQPFRKHSRMNTKLVIRSCYITHVTYKGIRNGYIISDTSIVM